MPITLEDFGLPENEISISFPFPHLFEIENAIANFVKCEIIDKNTINVVYNLYITQPLEYVSYTFTM